MQYQGPQGPPGRQSQQSAKPAKCISAWQRYLSLQAIELLECVLSLLSSQLNLRLLAVALLTLQCAANAPDWPWQVPWRACRFELDMLLWRCVRFCSVDGVHVGMIPVAAVTCGPGQAPVLQFSLPEHQSSRFAVPSSAHQAVCAVALRACAWHVVCTVACCFCCWLVLCTMYALLTQVLSGTMLFKHSTRARSGDLLTCMHAFGHGTCSCWHVAADVPLHRIAA
jgi:hypothetical protein